MPTKWEYNTLVCFGPDVSLLNSLGREGWELVSANVLSVTDVGDEFGKQRVALIFKRAMVTD